MYEWINERNVSYKCEKWSLHFIILMEASWKISKKNNKVVLDSVIFKFAAMHSFSTSIEGWIQGCFLQYS